MQAPAKPRFTGQRLFGQGIEGMPVRREGGTLSGSVCTCVPSAFLGPQGSGRAERSRRTASCPVRRQNRRAPRSYRVQWHSQYA